METITKHIGEGFGRGELFAALAYDSTDVFGGKAIKQVRFNPDSEATAIIIGDSTTAKTLAAAAQRAISIVTTSALATGSLKSVEIAQTHTGASTANNIEVLKVTLTSAVKTGGWANAIMGSINYSTAGAAHGLAAAICAEMIPPNASLARGALYALDLEFGCGDSSTWGNAGPVAFIRFANWGTKTHFSDNAFLFHLKDETSGTGNLLYNNTIRLRVGTTSWYMALSSEENSYAAQNAAGPTILNEAATASNPTLIPNRAEVDTGIGWQSDVIHIILGGVDEYNFAATAFSTSASNGAALGTATLMWSDLFLASEAVINFNNGNVTITHAAGALTLAGGTLTIGQDGTGHDVKFYSASTGTYMLWDESNETLDIVSKLAVATGTTSEDALKITVTDASTISGNINRGLHIDYTSSGAKTSTAQINAIGFDVTVSNNCPDVMLMAGYLATVADKTIGNLFGFSLYFEDFGNVVSNFCMLDLGYNSPHAPSGRNCFFRLRQHNTVQSGSSVLRLEGTNASNYLIDFEDQAGTGQSILATGSDTTDCTYKIAVRLTAHSATKYIHLFDS